MDDRVDSAMSLSSPSFLKGQDTIMSARSVHDARHHCMSRRFLAGGLLSSVIEPKSVWTLHHTWESLWSHPGMGPHPNIPDQVSWESAQLHLKESRMIAFGALLTWGRLSMP